MSLVDKAQFSRLDYRGFFKTDTNTMKKNQQKNDHKYDQRGILACLK